MVRLILILRIVIYTLFVKNKIKFGKKFFASPKIITPVHLWWYWYGCKIGWRRFISPIWVLFIFHPDDRMWTLAYNNQKIRLFYYYIYYSTLTNFYLKKNRFARIFQN